MSSIGFLLVSLGISVGVALSATYVLGRLGKLNPYKYEEWMKLPYLRREINYPFRKMIETPYRSNLQ